MVRKAFFMSKMAFILRGPLFCPTATFHIFTSIFNKTHRLATANEGV